MPTCSRYARSPLRGTLAASPHRIRLCPNPPADFGLLMPEADHSGTVAIAVPLAEQPAPSERQKDEEEDLEAGGAGEVGKQGDWVEKLCRICHLGSGDGEPDELELIELGCACRGELGRSHRPCAEAWFRIRGNRCCEICGVTAKNIKGEDVVSFMESWHGRRVGGSNSADGSSCWWNQPFCNFLILCFVLVFVLPWFFHLSVL